MVTVQWNLPGEEPRSETLELTKFQTMTRTLAASYARSAEAWSYVVNGKQYKVGEGYCNG